MDLMGVSADLLKHRKCPSLDQVHPIKENSLFLLKYLGLLAQVEFLVGGSSHVLKVLHYLDNERIEDWTCLV